MTSREIRKLGKTKINKQGQSHQSVYESLSGDSLKTNALIAETLSKIPSKRIIQKYKPLKIIFIISISLYALACFIDYLRILRHGSVFIIIIVIFNCMLGAMVLGSVKNLKWSYIISAILFTFIFFIMLIGIDNANYLFKITLFIILTIIIIGFATPYKLVTPYKKIVSDKMLNDKRVANVVFEFSEDKYDESLENNDVLDDVF